MLFHQRHRAAPPLPPLVCRAEDDVNQAKAAQRDAGRRFLEAVQEGVEIRQVTSDMRVRRVRNGYEDLIEDAFLRRPEKK